MMDGRAIGAGAIGDATRRDIAASWGGPDPRARQAALPIRREAGRRMIIRKP